MNKILLISLTILFFNHSLGQSEIIKNIKSQAVKTSYSLINRDFDTLIKYTHPNIVSHFGGKEFMLNIIKSQMDEFDKQGIEYVSTEIGDSITIKPYNNNLHALIPSTTIVLYEDQKIMSNSYLFGFSYDNGKNWTFTEAEKLLEDDFYKIFPDFKTNLEIPKKSQPYVIETYGELDENFTLNLYWEKLNINKRHILEKKIDEILRKKRLGYCNGGDNGKKEISEVTIYLSVKYEDKQAVMDLIDELLIENEYDGYDWLIVE